ncbi:MAG: DNA polymerase III subunit delta [Desulfobacca sp.]|uniref:DNA polymerase III subunit delta n=1 Tax=Desulfobacca sp. TaxID=2067990 RepID=UPI004049CD70
MSHPILKRHLQKGSLRPVYLCYGEEEFLIRRALAQVAAWLAQRSELAAKLFLEAADTPLADALHAARSPQLWGGRQLLVLWGVERYPAKELTRLANYCEAPSTWTCLILVSLNLKAKDVQASGLWRQLLDQEAVLAFPRLREGEVLKWLAQEAKQQGKTLGPGAAQVLLQTVGPSLAELAQELEKLILAAGADTLLSATAVQQLVSDSRVHTIFELVEALGQKGPAQALKVLHRLLALGEPASVILVMLARQLRLLLRTQEALAQGLAPAALANALGVPPFVAEKLQRQAAHLSTAQLQQQLLCLQAVDQQIKTGMPAPQLLLEKIILELCPQPDVRIGPARY